MTKRYVCIHGHFYQPPRENPWLEAIEIQDSAYPYRDWNERITAECYHPNTASRILDAEQRIVDIVNNYSRMSFNFGATLLSWMEKHAPKVYLAILAADKTSQAYFSGHGSAMAQVYNHMIMPLANTRDKRTQVIWGIADFEYRFKRKPEGMWLAETAVDIETLEILAEHGIIFTVLSPYQAHRVRRMGAPDWYDVSGGRVDPKMPYRCDLPSGRSIVLFFYDGPIARDLAFCDLLKDGVRFANRLIAAFAPDGDAPQLVHVATDGETYGHHHKFGNMALSFLFEHFDRTQRATVTIYGEFLEKCPPTHEIQIFENSSWSCAHGVERWRADCGCCIAPRAGWNQKWRVGLRQSMDWLRDELAVLYEENLRPYTQDAWALRDAYIELVLQRGTEHVQDFLHKHIARPVSEQEAVIILRLLEMQRHAMLMYTSCGWFFDDVSGIEAVQIIQYAARAIQLAREVSGHDLEHGYVAKLDAAVSNMPERKNGKHIYNVFVRPTVIDLLDVGAHYAISSLFEKYPHKVNIYAYTITSEVYEEQQAGKQRLVTGTACVFSSITCAREWFDFAILHLGEQHLTVGVKHHAKDEGFTTMQKAIMEAFDQNDITEVISLINKYFDERNYSLWDLFKNEQGKILNQILKGTVDSIETHLREIYQQYYPLMNIRKDIHIPLPKVLAMTVEFVLNRDLCDLLESDEFDLDRMKKIVREIVRWSFTRDKDSIRLVASKKIDDVMYALMKTPGDAQFVKTIASALRILNVLALELDLWRAQDTYFYIGRQMHRDMKKKADAGDANAHQWLKAFDALGTQLDVKIKV